MESPFQTSSSHRRKSHLSGSGTMTNPGRQWKPNFHRYLLAYQSFIDDNFSVVLPKHYWGKLCQPFTKTMGSQVAVTRQQLWVPPQTQQEQLLFPLSCHIALNGQSRWRSLFSHRLFWVSVSRSQTPVLASWLPLCCSSPSLPPHLSSRNRSHRCATENVALEKLL